MSHPTIPISHLLFLFFKEMGPTHFSHMSHPTFPISHLLFLFFKEMGRTPLFPYLTFYSCSAMALAPAIVMALCYFVLLDWIFIFPSAGDRMVYAGAPSSHAQKATRHTLCCAPYIYECLIYMNALETAESSCGPPPTPPGAAAVVAVQCVMGAFIHAAWNEDLSEEAPANSKKSR